MANSSSAIAPLTAQERAQRSVFVGNIPYEATEEQLKEIFLQAGPVVSFRLVYDRETGKPKGYGFCEYQDVDTAQSAMRNLNNHDFSGRPLRVGVAAGEQNKDDVKNMQGAIGVLESPYGDAVEPAKAPEAISKAVASLPPEQMFELMKQMKLCIQNNPNEARNMLLENPQLAYALLQAQIVMKIVDPQVAIAMLHRQTDQIPPLLPSTQPPTPAPAHQHDTGDLPGFSNLVEMEMNRSRAGGVGGPSGGGPPAPARGPYDEGPSRMGPNGPPPRGPPPSHRPDMHRDDMHGGRPDMMGVRGGVGPRGPPPGGPQPHGPPPRRGGPPGPRGGPPPEGPYLPPGGEPPRHGPRPHGPPAGPPGPKPMGPPGGHAAGPPSLGPDVNKEKTSLIMQVLRLSPEQIEMLPPDQRQSIMVLKEQISRSGTRPQ